jgi:Hemerythrin HHE cation binding domain
MSNELAVIVDAVLKDHAELDKTVLRLRGMCVVFRDGRAPADAEPAGLIEEFEAQLSHHFAAEEEFFESLVTEEPRLLQRVERLQADHGAMAEALDRLLGFAKGGPPAPKLAVRLARFLDWFDLHHLAENALMQEFFLLDQGGGGE